tara:strand:- start:141 stop:443 length:303 start_codon:yes stop_codon:yes gene_type:complete
MSTKNNVKLMEVFNGAPGVSRSYSLREIYINPQHVICLRSEDGLEKMLQEGRLIDGLDKRQRLTRVSVSNNSYEEDIIVIGSIDEVYKKLNTEAKSLLRG